MRSRQPESIIREVESLVASGVREINLVGQDLTAYGEDLSQPITLANLLHQLQEVEGLEWIRLLYAYPLGVTSELLAAIRELPKVCKYLDIPLQHSSERILKAMHRPLGKCSPRRLVEKIRSEAPEVSIRTTFIVGFPGETEEDVIDLESFIREGHFSSVGIFTYSPEQGTPSYELPGQIDEEEKEARRGRLMEAQAEVMTENLTSFVGKTLPLLLEGNHEDTDLLLQGRTPFQAPEVDGVVIVNDIADGIEPELGRFYRVKISEVAGYDLVGSIVL